MTDPTDDGGVMRSMVENIAREPLIPVDQWRTIERLVALGWTGEGIAANFGAGIIFQGFADGQGKSTNQMIFARCPTNTTPVAVTGSRR